MSNQIVRTPAAFIEAVGRRFGAITFDLAANAENRVVPRHYGPGSLIREDALEAHWDPSVIGTLGFLNPPFKLIAPWAKRCAQARQDGCRIGLLVPASVCTGWFVEHMQPHAYVFELTPRVFAAEIRDCIFAMFEPAGYVGRETWKWR